MMTFYKKLTDKKALLYKIFFTLLSCFLLFYFFHTKELYLANYIDVQDGIDTFDKIIYSHITFVVLIFLLCILIIYLKDNFFEKYAKQVGGMLFFLTPFTCFFALEYANIMQSPILWQVISTLKKWAFPLSILVLTLLLLFFFFITTSSKFAICFLSSFIALLGVGCYFTYIFRGIPFLASDITIIGTAVNVMADYQYVLNYPCYVLVLIMFLQITLACKLPHITWFKKKNHLILSCIYAACAIFCIHLLLYTPFLKNHKITVNTFVPQKSYSKNGAIMTLTRSIQLIMVDKPVGYSAETAKEIANRYQVSTNIDDHVSKKPNIIIVMDEAFSNLQSIDAFETNTAVMPFYDSLKENTIKGEMYVSVFGGQTANSEFEVLSSNSKAFLPASSTPYQLFIKDKLSNLTSFLKENGYCGNIALHPYYANGYNRHNVYPLLGFERFLNITDFENAEIIRKYVSDKSCFERIISEYENTKETGKPFFAFNVTMQNHSNYQEDYDNFQREIEITDTEYISSLSEKTIDEAERYLSLIHISDRELGNLITYFSAQEEDTIIVFFGDHMPGITEKFYTKLFGKKTSKLSPEKLIEKYKVPYLIWANFDIAEKENQTTSTNYLASKTLEVSGLDMPMYNRFLLDLSEKIPVITGNGYFGDDGKYYDVEDENSPYFELLNEYRILQYNNMFDKKNRLENFFD